MENVCVVALMHSIYTRRAFINVLETKPRQVGVMSQSSQVVFSGLATLATTANTASNTVGVIDNLKMSQAYYTDTMGRLLTYDTINGLASYYGHPLPVLNTRDPSAVQRFAEYVEVSEPSGPHKQRPDQTVVMTFENQVGFALSNTEMFVTPHISSSIAVSEGM